MYRVKDINGEKHLFLTDLCYGDNVLKAHTLPITIENLRAEIQLTKAVIDYLNKVEWTKLLEETKDREREIISKGESEFIVIDGHWFRR